MSNVPLNIIKFFHLDKPQKLSIIHFLIFLVKAKIIVKFIPLKYYYYRLFKKDDTYSIDLQQYYKLFSLFKKVIRNTPMHVTCLEESIAIQFYFRKFNIDLPIYLGIRIGSNNTLFAHAWSSFEDMQVNNYQRIN